MEIITSKRRADGELVAFIAQRRVRIGKLVDFADSIPPARIEQTIIDLFRAVDAGWQAGKNARRLRYYVILGALITRLLFDLEEICGSRSDWL